MSEGVNLQDADVVVHLDVLWTAARMEQRVGRVVRARILPCPHVHVYLALTPSCVCSSAVPRSELLVQRKWGTAKRVGSSERTLEAQIDTGEQSSVLESVPVKTEATGARNSRPLAPPACPFGTVDTGVASVRAPSEQDSSLPCP